MPTTKEQFKAKLIELGASDADAENIANFFYDNVDNTKTDTFVNTLGIDAAALFAVEAGLDNTSTSIAYQFIDELNVSTYDAAAFVELFPFGSKGQRTEEAAKFVKEAGLDNTSKSIAAEFLNTAGGADAVEFASRYGGMVAGEFVHVCEVAAEFVNILGGTVAAEFVFSIGGGERGSGTTTAEFVNILGGTVAAELIKLDNARRDSEGITNLIVKFLPVSNEDDPEGEGVVNYSFNSSVQNATEIIKLAYDLGLNNAPSIKTGTHQIGKSTYIVKREEASDSVQTVISVPEQATHTQHVYVSASEISEDGTQVTVTLSYKADNATLPGIGFILGFDSNILTFNASDVLVTGDIFDAGTLTSTSDGVNFAWGSILGTFPGLNEAELSTVTFDIAEGATGYADLTIEETSASAGFTFDGQSQQIAVVQA